MQLREAKALMADPGGLYCLDATHSLNKAGWELHSILWISNDRKGVVVGYFMTPEHPEVEHVRAPLTWLKLKVPAWNVHMMLVDDSPTGLA